MILFAQKPDAVFKVILHDALGDALAELQTIITTEQAWQDLFPNAARCFSRDVAMAAIQQLLAASKEPAPYRVTDYHYLLLYECLQNYCDGFNAFAEEAPETFHEVGPCRLREIDFEALVAIYFWDTDFLEARDVAEGIGRSKREELGMMDEAFAIAEGWAPQGDDLRLEPADESVWDDDNPEELFRPDSTRYPDPRRVEE